MRIKNKYIYVITFSSIIEKGFFTFKPFSLSTDIEYMKRDSNYDAYLNCTKFRIKFIARIFCYLLNKRSERLLELVTWRVQKVAIRKTVFCDYFLIDEHAEMHITGKGPQI